MAYSPHDGGHARRQHTWSTLCLLIVTWTALWIPTRARAALDEVPLGGRSRFYAGFAAGVGDGGWNVDGRSIGWGDLGGLDPIGVALAFRVGLTLSPSTLIWIELSGVGRSGGGVVPLGGGAFTTQRKAAVNHYTLGATWYPWTRGAFIRGGAGLSEAFQEFHTDQLDSTPRTFGFGLTAGAGWAFLVTNHAALVLEADLLKGFYGSSPGQPSSSLSWVTMLGIEWQ